MASTEVSDGFIEDVSIFSSREVSMLATQITLRPIYRVLSGHPVTKDISMLYLDAHPSVRFSRHHHKFVVLAFMSSKLLHCGAEIWIECSTTEITHALIEDWLTCRSDHIPNEKVGLTDTSFNRQKDRSPFLDCGALVDSYNYHYNPQS